MCSSTRLAYTAMQAGVKIRKITTASSRDIENTNHGYDFNQLVPIESLGIGKWKPLINFGKSLPVRSIELGRFLNDIGTKSPLEILLQGKHEFVNDLTVNAVTSSTSELLRGLQSDFVLDEGGLENDALPLRALSVLFAAKLFGNSPSLEQMSTTSKRSVEEQQLELAYATEFLFISQLFHSTVTNVTVPAGTDHDHDENDRALQDRENKVGTLIGDLLITKFYRSLASLESNSIMETMSVTLGAFAENAFEFEHEASGIPTDSLFRSAFKAAVVLAGHGNDVQSLAERLGEDFGQSYQLYRNRKLKANSPSSSENGSSNLHNQIESIENFILKIPGHANGTQGFQLLLNSLKIKKT